MILYQYIHTIASTFFKNTQKKIIKTAAVSAYNCSKIHANFLYINFQFLPFFCINFVYSIHQKFPCSFIAKFMPKWTLIFIHNYAYFRLKNYKKLLNRKIKLHFSIIHNRPKPETYWNSNVFTASCTNIHNIH